MSGIKVLIADDSVVYRTQIREALKDIPGVEITGVASNGRLALERVKQSSVDLIILDLEMPDMDGLSTLMELKNQGHTCKVLMFASISKRSAEITLECLRLGANDFITKPSGPGNGLDGENPSSRIRSLLEPKIKALFPNETETVHKYSTPPPNTGGFHQVIWDLFKPQVLVIASSTGGPTMLESVFSQVAGPLHCPIFITQHMPPIFTATLASRIQKISGITCLEGVHGQLVEPNTIYIAPGDYHMSLAGSKEQLRITLNQDPLINSVRPAADPLFESAANIFKHKCLGLVFTGMGADGRQGAIKIKEAGGAVGIQNESSCVVFGMPGAVMASGAYDKILSPEQIVQTLQEKVCAGSTNQIPKVSGGLT